jgi:hypothetical protein
VPNKDLDGSHEERHQSEGEHPGEDEGEIGHTPRFTPAGRRRSDC